MKDTPDFLIVANKPRIEELFSSVCHDLQMVCHVSRSFDHTLQQIDSQRYKYILIDLEDPELRPLQLLEWLQTRYVFSHTGVIYNKTSHDHLLQAVHLGATEHISEQDLSPQGLKRKLRLLINHHASDNRLREFIYKSREGEDLSWIGINPLVRTAFARAKEWSTLPLPIFIAGESGTGKTSLARFMAGGDEVLGFDAAQTSGPEQKETLLTLLKNIPTQENFVSLIVENIEGLSPELQEMLAAYFISGQPCTVGDASLQLIATSTQNLSWLIGDEGFREDLWLLLRENRIDLPPLKCRSEDIPLLSEYFLKKFQGENKNNYFSKDAMSTMMSFDWTENISELRETVKNIVASVDESMIPSRLLPPKILQQSFYNPATDEEDLADFSYNEAKKRVLNKFNRNYIAELLRRSDNNLTVAAERAGMDRSNFKKIIKKYGFSK